MGERRARTFVMVAVGLSVRRGGSARQLPYLGRYRALWSPGHFYRRRREMGERRARTFVMAAVGLSVRRGGSARQLPYLSRYRAAQSL
jgi:hypothetical protein